MFSDPNLIESQFAEIIVPNGKNVIIGIVYRPPNHNVDLFMEKFNQILFNISKSNKDCYIMGDYNIDLFHLDKHSPTQEFVDSLYSHTFYPLINRPTRITAHSATLIDNILTNNLSFQLSSGIILNDLSGHLPVFVYTFTEPSSVQANRNQHSITRDYSENNIDTFRTHLTNLDWSNYSDN